MHQGAHRGPAPRGRVTRFCTVFSLLCGSVIVPEIFPGPQAARAAASGAITEFTVPTFGSDPLGITTGPDGNLWITDSNDFDIHKVERITTAGVMTGAFYVPGGASQSCPQGCVDPAGIVTGPDGNLWFTELTTAANSIGKLVPTGPQEPPGAVTTYPVPTPGVLPWAITLGSDNNLWFTENVPGGKIGRITPAGTISEFPITTAGNIPFGITSGPDGNLWFTEQSPGGVTKVGVMDTTGTMVTETVVAQTGQGLAGITTGSDGNMWFTEQTGNAIGRINVATKAFDRLVGDGTAGPQSITSGPDGLLYFTEQGSQHRSLRSSQPAPERRHPLRGPNEPLLLTRIAADRHNRRP